jgi:hypothetical protein
MTFISRRGVAAVALASALALPAVATPAEAASHGARAAHSHSKHVAEAEHHKHAAHAKRVKKAKFVVVGLVKAVDATGVTVTVKGSNVRSLRGTDVVVTVPTTVRVKVDGKRSTLAEVAVGDRVAVKGVRTLSGDVTTYTAKKVYAKHPVATTTTETTTPVTS